MPPGADLAAGARLHGLVAALVTGRAVAGVHDCSDGGLGVALAEMAFAGGCGFAVGSEGSLTALAPSVACFSESANRVVVAVDEARVEELLGRAAAAGVPAAAIGTAGGDRLVWSGAFDVSLSEAETAWRDALPAALAGGVTPVG
jgi:phosphoribosylformylglycinamidine synthase